MILVLWLARLLDRLCCAFNRAADAVYRVYFRSEARKAARDSQRIIDAAIEDVIAASGPTNRAGSPLHRDR